MKIAYKFNKSSESRDCVVESVELEYKNNVSIDSISALHICNNFIKSLNNKEIPTIYIFEDSKLSELVVDYDPFPITSEFYVETNIGKKHYYFKSKFNNYILTFEDIRRHNQYSNEYFNFKLFKNNTLTFTSQQDLKSYINTMQEPIEFIAESDIDQVLMKEWIGEWEYKHFVYDREIESDFTFIDNSNKEVRNNCWWFTYKNEKERNWTIDGVTTIKIGSSKLNSNWTFKIK